MIAWWIGLQFATKAFFVTVTFIVTLTVGLQWISVKYHGSGWWA